VGLMSSLAVKIILLDTVYITFIYVAIDEGPDMGTEGFSSSEWPDSVNVR
jgi:hypothetical protein